MTDLNAETRGAWNANAAVWDAKMGDRGNDFFQVLCWPVMEALLQLQPGRHILDIACGNGLTSRRLAELGAEVTAFDFSTSLIELAKQRSGQHSERIHYTVADVTDEAALLRFGKKSFEAACCNMALFDIADIEPLFHALPRLLKPGGVFVFSITHPAFNNSSSVHVGELRDVEGTIETVYSVKVSRYMTPFAARGLALREQPVPHIYFDRPLQYYLNTGFQNGFVLDGFAERAFTPDSPQKHPLSWGGDYSEIPPVMILRMRLV